MGIKLFIFVLLGVSLLLSETGARVLKDPELQSVNGSKKMSSGPSPGVGHRYDNVEKSGSGVRKGYSNVRTVGVGKSGSSVRHEYDRVRAIGIEKSGPSPGEGHK
ncbi:hypothetical protein F3Y22_tig00111392pilonHSYRG00122 [Hibiscus syriacus]|uniref:Uncharacterized protein n=1 Tax=Hibiscus syriacus TaxID=106335 RepID=A0A6A2YB68_HIBSY|nr:hypothetical protein F3Y22_tig00111392pilonHSYRG00122 [Hibiscus syriacus]